MRTKRKEGSPLGISMCKIMCVYEGYIVRLYRKKVWIHGEFEG